MGMSEEQLNQFRLSGEEVRIVRDDFEINDVVGIVVAWDDSSIMIRKPSRRVVKLSRRYLLAPAAEPRKSPLVQGGGEEEDGNY